MILRRSILFVGAALLVIVPLTVNKIAWLSATNTTIGELSFEGMGNALDQMRSTYSVVAFKLDNDTIWFNASPNLSFKPGDQVPVRYNKNDPNDALLNTFAGIWLSTLIAGGIPLSILLIIFLNRHIVPYRSRVMLSRRKPFITVVD
jgi:ABC-type phosphate/phosphonate transport system permease subunit